MIEGIPCAFLTCTSWDTRCMSDRLPADRFARSPIHRLRAAAPMWWSKTSALYIKSWRFRWLIRGVTVFALGLLGSLVGMRISRAGWGWDVAATEFLTSPGAAGVAAVIAASIGAFMLNRQIVTTRRTEIKRIETTRKENATRLKHDQEVQQSSIWWESFEWVTSRALAKGTDDPELPPELAITVLQDLQKWAPNDTQKAACGVLVGHLTPSTTAPTTTPEYIQKLMDIAENLNSNQEQQGTEKEPASPEHRNRKFAEAIKEAENSTQNSYQMASLRRKLKRLADDVGTIDRVNEAVANYQTATDGSPAFSAQADGRLYKNRVIAALYAKQTDHTFQLETPIRPDSPTPPDAVLLRPSDDSTLDVYVFPHTSPSGRRSKIKEIEHSRGPDGLVRPFFVFRQEPEPTVLQSIERQNGRYAVWKSEDDTEPLAEAAIAALWERNF